MLASSVCGLVSVAIGVSTYSNDEKHGLRNVLFYQPISLSHLYWMRWLCGLCLALIPASCLVVLLLAGVNLSPSVIEKFHPLLAVFYFLFFGLIPFAVGAFTTHLIRNTLYAFFESVVAYAISLALILHTVRSGSVWLSQNYNDMIFRNDLPDCSSFFNVSLFLYRWFRFGRMENGDGSGTINARDPISTVVCGSLISLCARCNVRARKDRVEGLLLSRDGNRYRDGISENRSFLQ